MPARLGEALEPRCMVYHVAWRSEERGTTRTIAPNELEAILEDKWVLLVEAGCEPRKARVPVARPLDVCAVGEEVR